MFLCHRKPKQWITVTGRNGDVMTFTVVTSTSGRVVLGFVDPQRNFIISRADDNTLGNDSK